jgi:hypothetical protein
LVRWQVDKAIAEHIENNSFYDSRGANATPWFSVGAEDEDEEAEAEAEVEEARAGRTSEFRADWMRLWLPAPRSRPPPWRSAIRPNYKPCSAGASDRARLLRLGKGNPWRYTRIGSGGRGINVVNILIPKPTLVICGNLPTEQQGLLGGDRGRSAATVSTSPGRAARAGAAGPARRRRPDMDRRDRRNAELP